MSVLKRSWPAVSQIVIFSRLSWMLMNLSLKSTPERDRRSQRTFHNFSAASADKAQGISCTTCGKAEGAIPIVGALLSSKASAVKRISREDLPTPESPTKSTCV